MSYPQGGFVAWLQLPEGTNATELYLKAKMAGVIISPGTLFSSNPKKYNNSVRLTYAEDWTKERELAVQKVGSLAFALQS
jgi:DNA-binding transcriptional MocR family regulator